MQQCLVSVPRGSSKKWLPSFQRTLFALNKRTDYLEKYIQTTPYNFMACIPLRKEKAPADAVIFPSCKVLSVLFYDNYKNVDQAYLSLGEEVKKRNLTPIGFPRMLTLVAPYTGREIDPNHYCSRLVLPIDACLDC